MERLKNVVRLMKSFGILVVIFVVRGQHFCKALLQSHPQQQLQKQQLQLQRIGGYSSRTTATNVSTTLSFPRSTKGTGLYMSLLSSSSSSEVTSAPPSTPTTSFAFMGGGTSSSNSVSSSSSSSSSSRSSNTNNNNKGKTSWIRRHRNNELLAYIDDNDDINHDDDDDDDEQLLEYVPDPYRHTMPPRVRELVTLVTQRYVYGTTPTSLLTTGITMSDLYGWIHEEHRSRTAPVVLLSMTTTLQRNGNYNYDKNNSSNSCNTGIAVSSSSLSGVVVEVNDDLCTGLLSLAAMYRLPKEITLELLQLVSSTTLSSSSTTTELIQCRAALMSPAGWNAIAFPQGLSLRPRTKTLLGSKRPLLLLLPKLLRLGVLSFPRYRSLGPTTTTTDGGGATDLWREAAARAVQEASIVAPPIRRRVWDRRRAFLQSIELAQLFETDTDIVNSNNNNNNDDDTDKGDASVSLTSSTALSTTNWGSSSSTTIDPTGSSASGTAGPLFFPANAQPQRGVWHSLRRLAHQKYMALKRQGRAGIVSYCFFNCIFYMVGFVWQWPRTAVADPLLTSITLSSSSSHAAAHPWSATTLVARKFAKVFVHLYAVSQLLKLPKLFTAVGLAPVAARGLETIKGRLRVNETFATVLLVGSMVVLWGTVIAFPVLSEYASLKHILYLDEQLIQVYGLQPV